MVSEDQVSKTITSASDIEYSDIFKLNAYEYLIVTQVRRYKGDLVVDGLLRDGIYTAGQNEEVTWDAERIVENVKANEYRYRGFFAHKPPREDEPKGITGESLDMQRRMTAEAYAEYQEEQ